MNPVESESNAPSQGVVIRRIPFAGFWLRSVAYIIDYLLWVAVITPVIAGPIEKNVGTEPTPQKLADFLSSGSRESMALIGLVVLIYWLYYASLESSRWQATLGKKILGLYVTDMRGSRVTFLRASARFFGKAVGIFPLFFGFLMAAFTAKKQALHDLISGCLVLRKT